MKYNYVNNAALFHQTCTITYINHHNIFVFLLSIRHGHCTHLSDTHYQVFSVAGNQNHSSQIDLNTLQKKTSKGVSKLKVNFYNSTWR